MLFDQGFTIGGDLHELRVIIENIKDKSRVGVCVDTCHTHAAGKEIFFITFCS